MTIHAYAAQAAKQALAPFTYEPAPLTDYEIEISVTHCGICHSDLHILDGEWSNAKFPAVAGHEVVGTVAAVGSLVTNVKVGQRVGVGWQAGSCLDCEWCMTGNENVCRSSKATCMGHYGGFADKLRVDGRFAHVIPDKLSSENAAPLLCAGITVYSPLRHFGVTPASRVGVIGIGGLGHLGIQYANAFGCEVTAFSTSADKEAEARGFGAARFINSSDDEQLKAARNSLDFILCTVSVNLDFRRYLQILRPNGMLCLVGAIPDDIQIPVGVLINGQKSVRGGSIGGRATMREMLDFSARHNIVAKTECMPMSDINAALDRVRQNKARYRVVLVNE